MTTPSSHAIVEVIACFNHSSVVRTDDSNEPRLQLSRPTMELLSATVQAAGLRATKHHDRSLADAVSALAQFIAPLVGQTSDDISGPILGPQAVARLTRLCEAAFAKVRQHSDYMLSDAIVQVVRCFEPIVSKYRLESRIYLASQTPARYDANTVMREVEAAIDGLGRLSDEVDPSRI